MMMEIAERFENLMNEYGMRKVNDGAHVSVGRGLSMPCWTDGKGHTYGFQHKPGLTRLVYRPSSRKRWKYWLTGTPSGDDGLIEHHVIPTLNGNERL